ncbi:MAG: hypothetical protein PHU04_04835 [Candidatus Peribacteraceae bacterium]|nr:hypothetical protein [Candidatus Peribacteraceae bacterium]
MSTWLDLIPSRERQKLRELKKRSPEEYERLRERVKSVEQIAEEMDRNEQLAELSFALEAEPTLKDALRRQIEQDMREQGVAAVLEAADLPEGVRTQLERGTFDVRVDAHPETQQDQLVVVPEGNVQETIPVRSSLGEQYVQQFAQVMQEK